MLFKNWTSRTTRAQIRSFNMNIRSWIAVISALVGFACPSYGAGGELDTRVTRILQSETDYGGCMVRVSPAPSTVAEKNCPGNFVSFDCNGQYRASKIGNAMLQTAQLALVADKQLKIILDDSRKVNEYYCIATRVDTYPY